MTNDPMMDALIAAQHENQRLTAALSEFERVLNRHIGECNQRLLLIPWQNRSGENYHEDIGFMKGLNRAHQHFLDILAKVTPDMLSNQDGANS